MSVRCMTIWRLMLGTLPLFLLANPDTRAESTSISTTERGWANSAGRESRTNAIQVGYYDGPVLLNGTYRGFAWFDIPTAVQDGVITSASITIQVQDIAAWNNLLNSIDCYSLGSLTWSAFLNSWESDGTAPWGYAHNSLDGVSYQDSATENSTLIFDVDRWQLIDRSEIGFSFRAYPEIPPGWWGSQTHYITLNNPTLTIHYTATPLRPTNLRATDGSYCNKVRITWDGSTGATYYKLYRNGIRGGGDITNTSYDDYSAEAYDSYKVKAHNTSGDSDYSNSDTGYIRNTPPAPTGVSASDGAYCNKVRITWNHPGAEYYKLYRNGSRIGGNISSSSYDDTSAALGTTYSYTVKAHNVCGDGGLSSPNSGHRGGGPSAPTGLSATDGTYCDSVRGAWNSVSGASDYHVYRCTSSSTSSCSSIGSWQSGTSYDDTSASSETTYYYRVKARNSCDTSGYSSYNKGYRRSTPSAPSGVSATDGTYCDMVRVCWNLVSGADYYKVYQNGSLVSGNISGTCYDDTSAASGTTYSYRVMACNDCGCSPSSGSNSGYADCGPCPGGDDDGDGVCNANDNCPNDSNPNQEDCDGDGIGDTCDSTPYPDEHCSDGVDNDCDDDIDCYDNDCLDDSDCDCNTNGDCDPGETQCNCPEDCGQPPPAEYCETTCSDGADNDCDGLTDGNDPDCSDCTSVYHPCDRAPYCGCLDSTCEDGRIEACEAIAYVEGWKRGDHDEPLKVAGCLTLWKTGECYRWDDVENDWVPDTCE